MGYTILMVKWSCVFQTQRNKDRINWASINSTALVHWEYQVGLWTFQVLKKICSVKFTFYSGHNVENFCLLALGEGGWCLYFHWRICGCVLTMKEESVGWRTNIHKIIHGWFIRVIRIEEDDNFPGFEARRKICKLGKKTMSFLHDMTNQWRWHDLMATSCVDQLQYH